jgi:hypothetical protein
MRTFLSNALIDFNNYSNNVTAYQSTVNQLNSIFGFNSLLLSNVLPTYYAGNLNANRYVIIGINPGYNQSNINFENLHRTQSWNHYCNFHDNFFSFYQNGNRQINYYRYLAGVLAPQNIRNSNSWNYFNFCQSSIINIDIIPYHSQGFHQIQLNNKIIQHYLLKRFNNDIIPLLNRHRCNIHRVIIHDARLTMLLISSGFVNNSNLVYSNQTNNGLRMIYSVNFNRIEFRLFSRFIPNGGFSRQIIQTYI